ncbi:MAG: protein kinase [Lachnospiraceae bacterium]|nr:protein kinase [Lachnospiraceae bacterium]
MKESLNILDIQALLDPYIDFDFIDQLAEPKRKRDGHYYAAYLGVLRSEYASLAPNMRTLVIKEIMPEQADNYRNLSTVYNPYLETVYGILPVGNFYIALNEFICRPTCLDCSNEALRDKSSLSLEDYICHFGCLSEQEALIFMLQLCEGLETLKKFHIVHGDISPQNILLTNRFPMSVCPYPKIKGIHHTISVKIIDFDIAREQKRAGHLVTSIEGTRLYAAPEILDYQNPTDRVDIYSLGCILCYMLTGKSPKQLTPDQIRKACNPHVSKIIRKCTLDYTHRYHNITFLKRELQTTIEILSPRDFLHRLPGFRSNHLGFMCVAVYFYSSIILDVTCTLIMSGNWIEIFVVCLMPILGFDLFRLGDLSYTYSSYADRHPWIRIIVRFVLGLLLPSALMYYF